jgi:hypothetical protein
MDGKMTERGLRWMLEEAIYLLADENEEDVEVSSFSDVGMLTNNEGLVISVGGSQFQVTIVQSK